MIDGIIPLIYCLWIRIVGYRLCITSIGEVRVNLIDGAKELKVFSKLAHIEKKLFVKHLGTKGQQVISRGRKLRRRRDGRTTTTTIQSMWVKYYVMITMVW